VNCADRVAAVTDSLVPESGPGPLGEMSEELSLAARNFHSMMTLEPHGPDVFVGVSPVYPWGRIFGGQVVAQGLRAAAHTVDPRFRVHSLHAYFIRGGTSEEPVRYEVDRLRNGRSFVTRRVVARQSNGAILNLSCSFQVDEDQADVQTMSMPRDLPGPDDLANDSWGWLLDERNIEFPPGEARSAGWVRIIDEIGDSPILHACGLAFTSDSIQFGAARATHPEQVERERHHDVFIGASLDHAMWFHRPTQADEFHLYEFDSHGLIGGRGLVSGQLFSAEGVHVASVAQEVLLRYIGD
jgi:acyl-CoA thioesterase-2